MDRKKREVKVGEWVVGMSVHGQQFGGFVVSINKQYNDVTTRITGGELEEFKFITVPKTNVWSAEMLVLDLDELEELMEIALKMRDYKWCRRLARRKRIYMYYEGLLDEVQ
jgi:hypothetical protein